MMGVFIIFKYNASYIRQNIVHFVCYEYAYKKLYKVLIHKLYTLKTIANFLLVSMVTSYTENFEGFK